MSTASSVRFCEALESRRLLAATYNFGSLTGYTATRADWTYDDTYSLKAGSLGSDSGAGQNFVTSRRTGTGANRRWTLKATTDADFGSTVKVFQTDASGLNVVKFQAGVGAAKLVINLTGTRLAPNTLTVGRTYTDTGSFAGNFGGTAAGITATGTASGTTAATTRLVKTGRVSVPAGTFDAVQGVHTLAVNGTIRIVAQGQALNIGFNATYATTFWGVNNLGIVRQRETATITLRVAGESMKATLSTTADLVSSSLLQPTIRRASLFSATPVRPGPAMPN